MKSKMRHVALLASVALVLLTGGCATRPSFEGSHVAQSACDASHVLLSNDFALSELPSVWKVADPNDDAWSRVAPLSTTEGQAESIVRNEYHDWRNSQAVGEVSPEYRFGVGVSAELLSPEGLSKLGNRRALHADFARAMAYAEIVEQQASMVGFKQRSSDAGTVLQSGKRSAQALFGAMPIREVESYANGRYQYAVLAGWSPQVEQIYKGVALGCLGQYESRDGVLSADHKEALRTVLSSHGREGIPTGGKKVVMSNGIVGYVGFGAYPVGNDRKSFAEAAQTAELLSRSNTVRAVFTEIAMSEDLEHALATTENDFLTHKKTNERFDRELRGIRLPGVKRYGEMVVHDPLTGTDFYVVITGLFPQTSKRTSQALRQIIVDRFSDQAVALGVM